MTVMESGGKRPVGQCTGEGGHRDCPDGGGDGRKRTVIVWQSDGMGRLGRTGDEMAGNRWKEKKMEGGIG